MKELKVIQLVGSNVGNNLEIKQNNFLQSILGKAINNGINIGLRYLLPNWAEDKVIVNKDFETSIKGLRAIGDGAGVTRGLQQASANGLSVARSIISSMK